MKFVTIPVLAGLLALLLRDAEAEKNESFEGVITASLTRAGTQTSHFQFTRKGSLLRMENTDKKLEPVNIIDLEAKKLTIIYPHNTTYVKLDLAAVAGGGEPGRLGAPTIPMPPEPGSAPPATTSKIGAASSPPPGFRTPPPVPSMPPLPNKSMMPAMPPSSGFGSMPAMMPPLPGGGSGMAELKKTEQTKKIQGFDCTLYTLTGRGETFELWVTNDSALFPFRLLERDFLGHRFGPQLLEETWPGLLREKSLFPLEATLRMDPGSQERLGFKVEKIEKKKVEELKVFQPPEKYIEIRAPQF